MPSTGLDVHPINEKLRELRDPAGVKLVYDVIQVFGEFVRFYREKSVKNAIE